MAEPSLKEQLNDAMRQASQRETHSGGSGNRLMLEPEMEHAGILGVEDAVLFDQPGSALLRKGSSPHNIRY